jgi:PDZ domain-containing secreted protein
MPRIWKYLPWFIALIAVYLLVFQLPMPFVVAQPGYALPVDLFVRVGDEQHGDAWERRGGTQEQSGGSRQVGERQADARQDAGSRNVSEAEDDASQQEPASRRGRLFELNTKLRVDTKLLHMLLASWQAETEVYYRADYLKSLGTDSLADYVTQGADQSLTAEQSAILAAYRELDIPYTLREEDNGARIIAADAAQQVLFNREKIVYTPDNAQETVTLPAGSQVGPSAGLMFALQIVSELDPGAFTPRLRIAGTGTIDEDGNVGPIGGVRKKILTAQQAQMDVFLIPAEHAQEARAQLESLHSQMILVPVASLHEALAQLNALQ